MPSIVPRHLGWAAAMVALLAAPSQAQTRPFVYSVLPAPSTMAANRLYADMAYGRDLFQGLGPESFEQRVGLVVRLPSVLSFLAEAGWAPHDNATRSDATVRGELIARLPMFGRAIVALGAGGMQDYSRTAVATGRLILGYAWPHTVAAANLRLEHPFGNGAHEDRRDPVDVIMTLGLSHVATGALRLGLESVAEDLEALVASDEAEGGARVMLGPSLALAPPGTRWGLVVVAGPVVRLTNSPVSGTMSGARRDLPNTGYVIRTSLTLQW